MITKGRAAILMLLVVGIVASVIYAIYAFVQSDGREAQDFVLVNLGGILQLIGLAGGVWFLNQWGRFLIWAMIAWSLFGIGMTLLPVHMWTGDSLKTWGIGVCLFSILQGICVLIFHNRQKRATI